jgi:transcription elongation GreA/GreB family factor
MADIQYMTKDGYEALAAELKHMKSVKRPEISRAIAEAREKGDQHVRNWHTLRRVYQRWRAR